MPGPPPTPPSWLNGVNVVRHVQGNIWEINLTGYGRTLVGPYDELQPYIARQGLGEDAHHIVGGEHLEDLRTGFTRQNGPAVALERGFHNKVITPRIQAEQKYLGGRTTATSGRPVVNPSEVRGLYRSVYRFHTRLRELARISRNILAPARISAASEVPIASAPQASRAALDRSLSAASRGIAGIAGNTAAETTAALEARGVATELGGTAPRAAARTAASEVAQDVAASARVFVSSERTALKSLVHVARQFELLANAILLAGAIIEIVILYFKIRQEVKRQRAIEGVIMTKMGAWLRVLLIHEGEELAKVFLGKWNRPSELFLYASPRLEIRAQNGTDYKVEFSTAGSLLERAVSRKPLEAEEEELAVDYWRFQFSIPYPIFTPFDAYLAYVEVLGEYLAASWGSAIRRKKVDSATTRRLVDAAMDLATVAALLKTDEAAGFEDGGFNAETAVLDRQRTIRRIERLVEKRLSPALRHLEKLGILDPGIVVVQGVSSGIRGRMREVLRAEDRLSRYVNILAADLSSLPAKALRYQRKDQLSSADRVAADTLAYKDEFFAQFTEGVIEFIPKEQRPVPEVRQGTPTGDLLLVPLQ